MHRIDHSTAAASMPVPANPGAPGFFTNGNPQTGTPATIPGADWANAVQEEICNVVTGFGGTLNKGAHNQMFLAIQAAVGGVGVGEANTASNLGAGAGQVFASKSGVDLRFRSIKAGANVTVTQTATEITIAATGGGGGGGVTDHGDLTGLGDDDHPQYFNQARGDARYALLGAVGEANTGSNVGTGVGQVFKGKSGVDLQFKTLKAGANVTITNNANEVQIDVTGGGGGGEANTASNLGAGAGQVFAAKSGVDLRFRSIKAGTNVTVTQDANEITIAASAGSGEANTASNLGEGEGVFGSKSGVDLRFKSLKVGGNADISATSTEITVNPKVGLGANTFTGVQTATGFAVSSDVRLKDAVEYYHRPGRELRRALELYRWRWNELAGEALAGKEDSGVLAHEVEAIFPSCVHVGDDGFKRVDYGKLAVHLLLAPRN